MTVMSSFRHQYCKLLIARVSCIAKTYYIYRSYILNAYFDGVEVENIIQTNMYPKQLDKKYDKKSSYSTSICGTATQEILQH